MKRQPMQPITTFFARKRIRRMSTESIDSSSSDRGKDATICSLEQFSDPDDSREVAKDDEQLRNQLTVKPRDTMRRELCEDLTSLLQRRELVGCAMSRQLCGGRQTCRRRRKQQLVRWMLAHFQRLPVELQLAPYWERQAGVMCSEPFYVSCLEFDAGGVLLVAGASNGVIALYDFDDVFHRSLNLGQRMWNNEVKRDDERDGEQHAQKMTEEIVHPIHTIFTPFEVKCIRWNPLNEDEIACSFTNRNEVHVYNLGKFPSKPHKILKSCNHPSSGYNDLLYRTATTTAMLHHPQSKVVNVIAGDMDGAIRMWDPRFPLRPVWSILTGSLKTPINCLLLSSDEQFLICGTEAGMLMTYDIQQMIVPAFGSKPVPQQKAAFNIMEAIKPYLSPTLIETVLLTSRYNCPGIMSLHLMPESKTQVLCQLRNDWVVVINYRLGTVMKLHRFVRGLMPREQPKPDASPLVLSMVSDSASQRDLLPRSLRNSWLSCHRCTGTFLFDKTILCTGIHDTTSLTMIDLHHLRRIPVASTDATRAANKFGATNSGISELPAIERLDRFRIPMNSVITAVAGHPNQHLVICGGESMRLHLLGVMGKQGEA